MNNQNIYKELQELIIKAEQALQNNYLPKASQLLTQAVSLAKTNEIPLTEPVYELCSQIAVAVSATKTTRNKKWVEKRLSELALTRLNIRGTIASDQSYTNEALNSGLFLIDMGNFVSALTALTAGYEVLSAKPARTQRKTEAKASEHVSFLARMAKCHFELGNLEEAEVQLDKANSYFSRLSFEKISEDTYLYEAVSYFMQVDLEIARQAADSGRDRSNLSKFLANTLPGYKPPQ